MHQQITLTRINLYELQLEVNRIICNSQNKLACIRIVLNCSYLRCQFMIVYIPKPLHRIHLFLKIEMNNYDGTWDYIIE